MSIKATLRDLCTILKISGYRPLLTMWRQPKPTAAELYGINDWELHALSTYNDEVARGLMHTREWSDRMRHLNVILFRDKGSKK